MEHVFTAEAGGVTFRFNSMNVLIPSLFQVYYTDNGQEIRQHMKKEGDDFVFAMRDRCTNALLELEPELSYIIKQRYQL